MPERVNALQQWSVGSVEQNITFYLMLTVAAAMIVGQQKELNAREKKPMLASIRRALWRYAKQLRYQRRKRLVGARKLDRRTGLADQI